MGKCVQANTNTKKEKDAQQPIAAEQMPFGLTKKADIELATEYENCTVFENRKSSLPKMPSDEETTVDESQTFESTKALPSSKVFNRSPRLMKETKSEEHEHEDTLLAEYEAPVQTEACQESIHHI